MKSRNTLFVLTITFLLTLPANFVAGTPLDETPAQGKPEATIDLATKQARNLLEANGAIVTRRSSRSISKPRELMVNRPKRQIKPTTSHRTQAASSSTTPKGKS